MNDIEKLMNKEPVKQALSKLGTQMHMSPEMILAYARGVLSKDGRSKVASHIEDCKECTEVFNLANRLLKAEQEFDSEDLESKSAVHLSPKVISKLELAALLNSKKDELAEMVAKLLLPENSWGSIRPTIIVVRNQHKHSARTHREDVNELPVAAFSSGTGLERKQDFEAVMKVMNFVDLVHDLLLEHCGDVTDIKSELPKCVNNASALLHGIKLNKKANSEILKALSESLSADGE